MPNPKQNNHTPLVSVIIPVYNAQFFLEKCLDSVTSQTYENLEIIVINDGSTDSSLEVLHSFADKDPRILILDKNNAGVSSARNSGMNIARGEYVFFLDADDSLNPKCISALLSTSSNHDASIAMAHVYKCIKGSRFLHAVGYSAQQTFMSFEEYNHKLLSGKIDAYICGKLFPSFMVKTLRFNTSLTHGEDFVFLVSLLQKNKANVLPCKEAIYEYNYNPNSATSAISIKSLRSNILKLVEISKMELSLESRRALLTQVYSLYWRMCKKVSLYESFTLKEKVSYIRSLTTMIRVNKLCSFWNIGKDEPLVLNRLLALPYSLFNQPLVGICLCRLLYTFYSPKRTRGIVPDKIIEMDDESKKSGISF